MSKRILITTLLVLLALAFTSGAILAEGPAPTSEPTAKQTEPVMLGKADWTAEYYNNPSLNGTATKTEKERMIDHDWGLQAPFPGFPADHFSVRWTSSVNFREGNYRFIATVDDGVRIWIDGELILDEWQVQSPRSFSANKWISQGEHIVQMAYFENTEQAVAKLWWEYLGNQNPMPPIEPPMPPECPPGCVPEKPMPPQPPIHPPQAEVVVVDNTSPGFMWGGTSDYRYQASGGVGNSFYYTQNTQFDPENYGKWTPMFTRGGKYEVFVFIPATHATSTNLRYRIMHDGSRSDQVVSQWRYSDQWVSLGTYLFQGKNNGSEFVVVYDNTREPYASTFIAYDAVKFVPR